jgi:hypothetical protein
MLLQKDEMGYIKKQEKLKKVIFQPVLQIYAIFGVDLDPDPRIHASD